jgi:hypothetical protein
MIILQIKFNLKKYSNMVFWKNTVDRVNKNQLSANAKEAKIIFDALCLILEVIL